jgi:hypothetical protein
MKKHQQQQQNAQESSRTPAAGCRVVRLQQGVESIAAHALPTRAERQELRASGAQWQLQRLHAMARLQQGVESIVAHALPTRAERQELRASGAQ